MARVLLKCGLPVLLALAGLSTLGGCSSSPGSGGPDEARTVLGTVLEAWKAGESPDAASERSGIVNGDPRWLAGYKLVGYRISDQSEPAGFDVKYEVALELQDPKGQAVRESAFYTVASRPVRTVIRAPFEGGVLESPTARPRRS